MPQAFVRPEHDDFPVSCADFVARLKGTPEEIWSKLITTKYGQKKFVYSDWRAILTTVKKG